MKLIDRALLDSFMASAGLTATALAKSAGCSKQYIGQLRTVEGKGCRPMQAAAITRALGVPLGELFAFAPGEETRVIVTPETGLLDTAQVAAILRISPDHVRKLRRIGELKGVNVGGMYRACKWRFHRAEVDRFIAARSVAA